MVSGSNLLADRLGSCTKGFMPLPRLDFQCGYGLVAMTFASHAKGREFDPHYPYMRLRSFPNAHCEGDFGLHAECEVFAPSRNWGSSPSNRIGCPLQANTEYNCMANAKPRADHIWQHVKVSRSSKSKIHTMHLTLWPSG